MDDKQLKRLPQYAQDELRALRMGTLELQSRIDQFNGDIDSPISRQVGIGEDQPIPNGTIRFNVENGYVTIRVERGGLYLNASRSLVIKPEATNAARLHVMKDF